MDIAAAVIRQDGEGEHRWFAGGGVFTMKATAADTGGAFMLFEDRVVRGKTTPLHLHANEDEAIYVLDGELLVHVDGAEHRVGSSGFFFAPRGVAHAFLVTSETARLLCLQTPGSGEAFYRSVSDLVSSLDDASRPADFARLQAAARASASITVLGPPPFRAFADADRAASKTAAQEA
jgi:quercetin dioxygenase-like cupin family protein